jgi:hypothetical protein
MFTLDHVVLWGRSFDEYQRMFALSASDLDGRILGCADGPASFNAEATRRGHRVVSCDPVYGFARAQIQARIDDSCDQILNQTRQNADRFVWKDGIRDVDELRDVRMKAMRDFLADYDTGRHEGRYLDAGLPALPFADSSFDLALCSHLLFLYSIQLGEDFHLTALRELRRVARDVRVFPLLALDGQRSPFVERCVDELTAGGSQVTIEQVPYEFQQGGNEMLRVRANR